MAVQVILNELSWAPAADTPYGADARMQLLLDVVRVAIKHGAERGLRVTESFYGAEIAPGVTALGWRDLPFADPIRVEFFRDLVAALQIIEPGALQPDFQFTYD